MGFVDKNKEYVIENMYPKRPWMNYLWNEDYIAIINQFGFGKGRFASENNYQRDIVKESDSRIIYIRDASGMYALNRNYDNLNFDKFETVVGMGYSKIISEYQGLHSELTILVPHKGRRECWRLELTNISAEDKSFDMYAFADLDSNISWHLACNVGDFNEELNGVYFSHKSFGSPTEYHFVHFASDHVVTAYETARRRFIGTYGSMSRPDGIVRQSQLESIGNAFDHDTTAVLQFKIEIKAGEKETVFFTVGAEKSIEDAIKNSKAVLSESRFNTELALLNQMTGRYDNKIHINTPDDEVNRFVNIWLKRQMDLGKTWGRVYNKGFRDIMQDIAGFIQLDAMAAREKIIDCVQYQKEDGNTLRSWVPVDRHPYRDGAVWLIPAVVTYIKETGDISILDERAGYFESDIIETVFEHCVRGIDFLHREVGAHGLCLWGGGDWNDSFDGAGLQMIGESVWLSIASVKSTNEFIELLDRLGKASLAKKYREKRDVMAKNINKHGWDKDHYIYGINDWDEKVGSYDTSEGQIFLNPQTWAVLAGVAEDNEKLMELVENELSCDYGYVQQKPCYRTPDPHVGRISYFDKGFYENGSVYNHGVAFKLVADCVSGRGNQAYATLKKLFPSNPKNDYTKSGVEPYALCNMFFGPENEVRPGEAPMHWITGTSSWTFRGIVEYLIGVRAEFDGLKVQPCLPNEWDNVSITRIFRGAQYDIQIKRGEDKGITIDGNTCSSNILPPFADGGVHIVTIII